MSGILANTKPGNYTFVHTKGSFFARFISIKNHCTGQFLNIATYNADFSIYTARRGTLLRPTLTTQLNNVRKVDNIKFQIDPDNSVIPTIDYGAYWYEFFTTNRFGLRNAVVRGPFIVE